MTVPILKNIRWRYCTRWDERPAAMLGSSLLRLGICVPEDWTGSAVDFVERGFQRFCKVNGIDEVRRAWEGDIRIVDDLFGWNEQFCHEARSETKEPPTELFLVVDFSAATWIPIGAAFPVLEREDPRLPAAFYAVLIDCLWKWMRVYGHADAAEHAEMLLAEMDQEELEESVYPRIAAEIPDCVRGRLKMSPHRANVLLRKLQPRIRSKMARDLLSHLLEIQAASKRHSHSWPNGLVRKVPGLEEYLSESDGIGPGCLLNWYEGDAINACFDEELTYMGQNGPLAPSTLRMIRLDKPRRTVDRQLRSLFDYIAAMLRSLAAAAKMVEIMRELSDEQLREHRLKSGLQAQPGASGVRNEQL